MREYEGVHFGFLKFNLPVEQGNSSLAFYFTCIGSIWAIYEINPYPECFGHFGDRIPLLFTTFWGDLGVAMNGRIDQCMRYPKICSVGSFP